MLDRSAIDENLIDPSLIDENFSLIRPKPRTKENILGEREILRLTGIKKGEYEEFAFMVLLFTGLRVSEFVHMRSSWVDLERRLITIPARQKCSCVECRRRDRRRRNLKPADRGYWKPKTAASVRTIPVVPEIQGILRRFFKDHEEVLEAFPSREYVNNVLKRLQDRSGIRLFPHALRGTFATMMAEKGFTPFEIQDALGWASVQTAMDYIKLSGSAIKTAFARKW